MSERDLAYLVNVLLSRGAYTEDQRIVLAEMAQAQQRLAEAVQLGYPPELDLMREYLSKLAELGKQAGLDPDQVLAAVLVGWNAQFKSDPDPELAEILQRFRKTG